MCLHRKYTAESIGSHDDIYKVSQPQVIENDLYVGLIFNAGSEASSGLSLPGMYEMGLWFQHGINFIAKL